MFSCCRVEVPVVEEVQKAQALSSEQRPEAVELIPETPEFGIFTVQLRPDSSMGIEVDATTPTKPMIKALKPGAASKLNELSPGSIQVYDVVVAINGAEDWEAKKAKMEGDMDEKVILKLHRPKKLAIFLKKTGGLGMKLDYTSTSLGAVIGEIHPDGLMQKWNNENKGIALQEGDRLIEFEGTLCKGTELLNHIKVRENLELTALKY